MPNTNWYDEYKKRKEEKNASWYDDYKKEKEKSGDWVTQYQKDFTDRVNKLIKSHDSQINAHNERFSGRKENVYDNAYVSDAADWYKSAQRNYNSYRKNAKYILDQLAGNSSLFNEEWAKSVKSAINGQISQQKSMLAAAKTDNDFWSSFGSEDNLKNYGTAENAYKAAVSNKKDYDTKSKADLGALQVDYDDFLTDQQKFSDFNNAFQAIRNGGLSKEAADALVSDEDVADYVANGMSYQKAKEQYIQQKYAGYVKKYFGQDKLLEAYRGNFDPAKEMNNLGTEKKSYLESVKDIQKGNAYRSVLSNNDFDLYDDYASTGEKYDKVYEFINGADNGNRDKVLSSFTYRDPEEGYVSNVPYEYDLYEELDDEEISIYNYYYAKNGKAKADEYLESLMPSLEARLGQSLFKHFENAPLLEIAFSAAAGLDQFSSGVESIFNFSGDKKATNATQVAAGLMREDLGDFDLKYFNFNTGKLENAKIFGNSLGQSMFDLGNTTANMLPSVLTSTAIGFLNPTAGVIAGNALTGVSSAGNAYQEMINLGYNKQQAGAYGAMVGGSEALLSYALGGISALNGGNSGIFGSLVDDVLPAMDNAIARAAIQIGGNMLDEGLEEGIQEILDPWFKNLTLQTNEKVNWNDVAYSTLLGALTAGFMEGPATIAGEVNTYKTGKKLQDGGITADRLAKVGHTFAADSVAYQLADKVTENTDAYTLGRLFNEIDATITQQNVDEISRELVKTGWDAELANSMANTFAEVVEGAELSDFAIATIEANEPLARVLKSVLIDSNTTWNQRSQGYNAMLKSLADEVANPKPAKKKQAQQTQENASVGVQNKMPTESRAEAGSTAAVSISETPTQDHKEAEEVDTSPAKVKNIADIGKKTITLEDGSEVNVKDADLSVDDGVRIETIASIDGISTEDANFVLNTLRTNPGASAQMASLGAKEVYKYGFYGLSLDHVAKYSSFGTHLTEPQRQAIYNVGRQAKERQINAATPKVATKQRGIYFDQGNGKVVSLKDADKTLLSEKKRSAGVQAAIVLHKLGIGGDIYFFESYRNSKGQLVYKNSKGEEVKAPNGWFSASDGSIHIDLNAGAKGDGFVLFTLAHELTHFIEKWSPKKYKLLADFLIENYEKGRSVDELVRTKQTDLAQKRGEKVSYDEAYSEVIADSMEAMLADGNVIEKIMELKAKDSDLVAKIKQFFDNLLAKIRSVYKGLTPDSDEGLAVLQMKDSIEKIQQLFAEGLVEASENFQSTEVQKNTTEDGGVVMSIREVVGESGKAYGKGVYLDSNMLTNVPEGQRKATVIGLFRKLGGKKVIAYDQNGVSVEISIAEGKRRYKKTNGKSVPVNNHITSFLNNPIKQEALILADELIAASHFDGQEKAVHAHDWLDDDGKNPWDVWKVFLQEKNNSVWEATLKVANTVDGEKVLYEVHPIEMVEAARKPGTSTTDNKVSHPDPIVKSESIEALDVEVDAGTESVAPAILKSERAEADANYMDAVNRGDTETAQKMVDEAAQNAGYTVKAYHGTNADTFSVFDKGRVGESTGVGILGDGFYFAEKRSVAQQYGKNVYAVYLKQATPYTATNNDSYKLNAVKLETDGYDSVVMTTGKGKIYMVLDPEQIKSADPVTYDSAGNVIPLSQRFNPENDDIRYSDRDYSYAALISKPDMVVTTVDGNVPKNRADVVAQAKQNAAKVGKFDPKTGSVSVRVKDTDMDVVVGTAGLKHSLDRRFTVNAPVTLQAGAILKNSIQINELTPQHPNAQSSYVLIGAAKSDNGQLYIIRSVVNRFSKELTAMDVLYAFNAKTEPDLGIKKETGRETIPNGPQPKAATITGSTISIADLLDLVNQYFPDILPEDVLKHYGYDARPDGDLGSDVLYQYRAEESVSNRSLLANALESAAKDDMEKKKLREYREQIEHLDAEEQKLRELNGQIKELSFAKGKRDTKKISALRDEATKTANRIGIYDKRLLRLEASKPLQDVLDREKKKAYKRAEQKGKEALAAYKEKATQEQKALAEKWQESRKAAVAKARENREKAEAKLKEQFKESRERASENRTKTAMRHKIQGVVGELNQLLKADDKKRHIPDSLKKAVAEALMIVNMDNLAVDKRVAEINKLLAELYDKKAKAEQIGDQVLANEIQLKIDDQISLIDRYTKMSDKLQKLQSAYEDIQNSDDPDIASGYDPVIAGNLKELAESIGDTPLAKMSVDQLQDVYDMYKMVLTRVRDANKSLVDAQREAIKTRATKVVGEVKRVGGEHKLRVAALDFAKRFGWDNLKPVYAFAHIGSDTLTKAFNDVRKGEDTWAKDVTDARKFYLDKARKYNYDSWDFDKKHSFESASGIKFDLTLEQILALYAYSKRDQALEHLRLGGFVFDSNIETYKEKGSKLIKYKVNTADAHQITPEILADITGLLTKEQIAFVDEMQDYLSTTMGAKGNEVTMKMCGVKLFKENFYFPLKSAKQFMFEQNEVAGEVRIKNSGFTNKTKPNANNPVILNNFMDVWTGHVNDMSMYHAFTLPLEDFNRIFNYESGKQEGQHAVSVKGTIQNAYGPAAVSYVRQLITDLNGGAVADPRESTAKALVAKFKKAKVFTSFSVVVQQPSAIARAFALIDPKYFRPTKDGMSHKELWNEVKQYAPVAIIKEMGYFDTNMGRSASEYIQGKEYSGFTEKLKAFAKDGSYRDEVMSRLPALADEMSWCAIWNAVKRETVHNHQNLNPGSKEFLEVVGERFTEVITKTQVYDSVLARSANMRSKTGFMNMATSFMAEPTTTINMLQDAIVQKARGKKKYAGRVFGSVLASIVLNNVLVSVVYAGRDDDEDETYIEKYLQSFAADVLNDVNPITYYPFLKDIWSLSQGYDVERSDMSLVGDLIGSINKISKAYNTENGDVAGAWLDATGSAANLAGIPMQNIRREINAVINFYKTLSKDFGGRATTKKSLGNALVDSVREALPVAVRFPGKTKADKLYDALVSGDDTYADRLFGSYKDEDAANSAIRSAIKKSYESGDIDEDTAMEHLVEYGGLENEKEESYYEKKAEDNDMTVQQYKEFELKNDAYWKVEEWKYEAESEDDFSKYDDFLSAVKTGKNLKSVIKEYTDHGVSEKTLASQITKHYKPLYKDMSNSERAAIKGYLLNAYALLGYNRAEKSRDINDWLKD